MRRKLALAAAMLVTLSGCTAPAQPSSAATLTVLTHESFELPDELIARFEHDAGVQLDFVTADSGALVNQLILTKDAPLADVVYGIDNTFASRAVQEQILVDYTSPALPPAAQDQALSQLTPIDFGDVCLNADLAWFQQHGLALPETLTEITRPEYRDLTVVINPTSSATGLAFLLATIGEQGDAWLDYWHALQDNGVKVAVDWTEAYYTDFSGADGAGPRPLVLSYATSPAYTVEAGSSTTKALLKTCFRQVEYAGVLAGASNEKAARAFIDFLLSAEVQAAIPSQMYMYPINPDVELPDEWVKFAPLATEPIDVPLETIDANRDAWLRQWSEALG